ncbi:hypothetical protein Ancab_039969 [Ancistrocladus abbreviatus]
MEFLSFLLYLLLVGISIQFLHSVKKRSPLCPKKLPPGPFPLPIIGNILELGRKPHKSLTQLAKAYGPVITLELGCVTTIVISSVSMAKEVLKKNDVAFSNRAVTEAVSVLNHSEQSVVFLPPTEKWRILRRICTSHVFANSRLEAGRDLRREKVQQLLSYIRDCSEGCRAVNIGQAAFSTTLNFLSNAFFSKDWADLSCDNAQEFKEVVRSLMVEAGTPNIADFFPVLKIADPQGIRHRARIHADKMITLFNTLITERLKSAKQSNSTENKDVLDTLLGISEGESKEIELSDITHLLLDLFVAGTDTTSSTLEWAMTELLRNPEKLKKTQAELAELIGRGNIVEEADVDRLSYLQAVIKETFRLHPPVPFLVPRKVNTDVKLDGYIVPKNAQVMVNVWAIGRDPNVWDDPNSFQPERFLGSQIDFKGRDFELIPFGAGRRICPGLPLASRMLHLILGSLLHSFNWKLEDMVTPESLDVDDKFGITLQKAQPLNGIPICI